MSPDREVELKFLCAPEDLGAVLAAAPAGDEETHELISVYFDTPDHTLQKAGASLRVRESEGRRVQTLKRGEGVRREEFEAPIPSHRPDPALGPLKDLLAPGEPLKATFNVRVTRRQRLIRLAGAEIELALDQGEVSGARRSSAISEVELELKAGPLSALFDLARTLAQAAPLYISFQGKASRGQALVAGSAAQAQRHEAVDLPKDCAIAQAFQMNARHALSQITGNGALLRKAPSAEAVHQLRVGARRLRSAMTTFKPVLSDEALAGLKDELKWLAKSTDRSRNLDVLAAEAAGRPGFEALAKALAAQAKTAQDEVVAMAGSARFRALTLALTAWVEAGDWLANAQGAGGPVAGFADQALAKHLKKLKKKGRDLAHADDAARHHARIEAKKLRYALEGFASLYPAGRTKRFMSRLKALQEELGVLNDIATAEPLMSQLPLAPPEAFAAGKLAGLRAAEKAERLERAAKAFEALMDTAAPGAG